MDLWDEAQSAVDAAYDRMRIQALADTDIRKEQRKN